MSRTRISDQRNDAELIQVCNVGDAASAATAFAALYQRHKDYVIRVALRFVPDNDAALDVLQETFSYLLRKFPPTGAGLTLRAELTTLLYPVAKNNAISLRRKADRFPASESLQPDDLHAPASVVRTDLQPLLAALSDERREVILLRFVDDMSMQDIAAALQIPLGTVKSRLHLALKQLRQSPDAKKFFDP